MPHCLAMLPPVAPSGLAQPSTTSSTCAGSMPARLTACAITWPPSSAPCVRLKAPRTARPIGVRAVETMTASTMVTFSFYRIDENCGGGERFTAQGGALGFAAGCASAGLSVARSMRQMLMAGSPAWRQLGAWVMASASFGGLAFLPLFSDELLFRQLADRGLGQGVAELQLRGQFVPAELVGQKCTQFLKRKGLPRGLQLDERLDRLTAVAVWNANDAHLGDGRMFVNRLLDGTRVHVKAAGDDHVLLAIDNVEKTIRIHVADIARQKPAVDKGGGGVLGRIEIAPHHVRPLDADFADLTRLEHPPRIVKRHDVHENAGQRQAARAGLVGAVFQ